MQTTTDQLQSAYSETNIEGRTPTRSDPKVSVIMPVHNAGRFLRSAVDSILNQKYSDFELLIVDDGSDDETPDTLAELASHDDRIRVLRNHHKMGLGYTLDRLVREARAEWVARMDADDIADPERLGRQIDAVNRDASIAVLGTQAVEIDWDGKPLRLRSVPLTYEAIRALLPWVNPVIHPSVMFSRRAILSVGSYNPRLRSVEDYDLWFRCVAAGLKIVNLPDVLLGYRIGRAHYSKRGWSYRITEMRVRWEGYRLLGCSSIQRLGVLIPLGLFVIGLLPQRFSWALYGAAKRLDPRGFAVASASSADRSIVKRAERLLHEQKHQEHRRY